jgi:peroxiredoxin
VGLAAGLLTIAGAQATPGIEGRPAPSWDGVREWYNLPDGVEALDISDYRGRVLYLYGFQSWCPGCHRHGFPTLRAVSEAFTEEPGVAFVAIQTVFEGFGTNTSPKALATVKKYELDIPVGHDPGPKGGRSTILDRYRTGGTPWTIVIDRGGRVRYNAFSIDAEQAVELIERLLAEEPPVTEVDG